MSNQPDEEHLIHLKLVLTKLRIHKLYAQMAKCDFNKPEVKFLGHVVGRDGIKVDPAKFAVIQEWPVPTSTTELRQFWGLANYFQFFVVVVVLLLLQHCISGGSTYSTYIK